MGWFKLNNGLLSLDLSNYPIKNRTAWQVKSPLKQGKKEKSVFCHTTLKTNVWLANQSGCNHIVIEDNPLENAGDYIQGYYMLLALIEYATMQGYKHSIIETPREELDSNIFSINFHVFFDAKGQEMMKIVVKKTLHSHQNGTPHLSILVKSVDLTHIIELLETKFCCKIGTEPTLKTQVTLINRDGRKMITIVDKLENATDNIQGHEIAKALIQYAKAQGYTQQIDAAPRQLNSNIYTFLDKPRHTAMQMVTTELLRFYQNDKIPFYILIIANDLTPIIQLLAEKFGIKINPVPVISTSNNSTNSAPQTPAGSPMLCKH